MRNNKYIGKFLVGINKEKLAKDDENELSKFRANIANTIKGILYGEPKEKAKAILALKAGLFELISQIPVVTPIVTAVLQAITSEDLGSKIDDLGKKMDGMMELQKQTISLQKQTISLQKQTISLQKQTISLQKQTISLQKQTIYLQKQTLNLQRQTIKEIHQLSERVTLRK